MNSFASLLNHPDISFSPIPDSIKVDNPATGEILAFVRTTCSDDLKLLLRLELEINVLLLRQVF